MKMRPLVSRQTWIAEASPPASGTMAKKLKVKIHALLSSSLPAQGPGFGKKQTALTKKWSHAKYEHHGAEIKSDNASTSTYRPYGSAKAAGRQCSSVGFMDRPPRLREWSISLICTCTRNQRQCWIPKPWLQRWEPEQQKPQHHKQTNDINYR